MVFLVLVVAMFDATPTVSGLVSLGTLAVVVALVAFVAGPTIKADFRSAKKYELAMKTPRAKPPVYGAFEYAPKPPNFDRSMAAVSRALAGKKPAARSIR